MTREPKDLRGWIKATEIDLSKAIRMEAADSLGVCQCVTCDHRAFWNAGMQAGHFIGKLMSIKFVELGIKVQCSTCNNTGMARTFHQTRQRTEIVAHAYQDYMRDRYGQDAIDALRRLKNTDKTWTPDELRVMRFEYKARFKAAKEARGL